MTHKEQFIEKGYKLTEQRQAILDVISKNKGRHLSSEEIFKLVKKTNPEIGLATIYRTLPLLEEMKLIRITTSYVSVVGVFLRYKRIS